MWRLTQLTARKSPSRTTRGLTEAATITTDPRSKRGGARQPRSPSHELLLYRGHTVLHGDPTGKLTLVSYNGSPPKDICAMLS